MEHHDWQEQVPFYVANTLSADQRQVFEQHLVTCRTCQSDIREWRTIAAAVWQEADDAARRVPPLSQEVYNRLTYRDRPLTSRYSTNPPRPHEFGQPSLVQPRSRALSLPITMAAGIAVAFLFGALLITLAFRRPDEDLGNQIALHATGTSEALGSLQDIDSPTLISLHTETPGIGILPTLMPTEMPPTNTAISLPPNTGGGGGSDPTGVPPPTSENSSNMTLMVADGPPFITLTPGLTDSGVFLCTLFNPNTVPIDGYTQANYGAAIAGEVLPGQEFRTLVRSVDGWYEIVVTPGQPLWIPPDTAYLRGNCDASQFWVPTPTAENPPDTTIQSGEIIPAGGDTTVVIEAAFANFYSGPGFEWETTDVTERGNQFPVIAYATTGNDRWIQVRTPDGQERWLWAAVVTEYNNADLPSQP